MSYTGAIFDLDGVLVDTAKFHYLAWKQLAERLGFPFTPEQNEKLKGVSRMESLNLLLKAGGMEGRFKPDEKERMAAWKNKRYVESISTLNSSNLLDGAAELLERLHSHKVKIALGSASKNAPLILKSIGISSFFDAVVDGNKVTRTKPDPQVFLLAAHALNLSENRCVVFEDSEAGLQAAKCAGMYAIGIGSHKNLPSADMVYKSLTQFPCDGYF
ncbi:MAG: beta-phosphoglucomutase [Oscillospiraceae bacterium]|nr:beta-phosphoglucomutase [Oscillospiraceae bacterium]